MVICVLLDDGSSGLGLFRVDPVGGELETLNTLDRDTSTGGKAYYDVTVVAADQGSPSENITRVIRVGLVDINDNDPQLSVFYDTTTTEGDAVNTGIMTFSPSDDDETAASYTYSIDSGDTNSNFKMASNEIQVNTVIDLDAGDAASYTLEISVDDGVTPARTTTTTVYITVTSTNDEDPVFGTTIPTGTLTVSFDSWPVSIL